ncbi:MAG: L-ribulose-5-phosphate 4-epimerase [Firmicutes bacterium]|nr:L-ribulose-5-phosphate 4-epimerase [Bacillota bacterium]HHU50295.1 L-ribulose-5-phosphate 4-epimerase [Bacillota bacterium]
MLERLKEQVLEANLELYRRGLVIYTWGNASGIDREQGLVVIKPSGVAYEKLRTDSMVVLTLDGEIVEGELRPSSDTPTHLGLYRGFPEIGGVVHTHSPHATVWAQANREIPCFGTTHADYFYGAIPCVRVLTKDEVTTEYEKNTAQVIIEYFQNRNYQHLPGVLVAGHAPFTWGKDVAEAVHNSVVLEEIAKMAFASLQLNPELGPLPKYLLDKHFLRKHGPKAYYGQAKK